MALLGRISAVLTANTQDFTRQIGTARREIQDFARQARGVQFNLNTRSLDGTLTQLQRFQRTIREIQQLQARGVDAGLPNANRLRDQFRAFEDVGRPLTAVKNQIEGLSNTVQAELYPALERVQAGFRNLYNEIDAGTTTYDRSAARIENLQRRITALGRATAAAGDFSNLAKSLNANNTGASFFQPRARESLQRSLELRNQAQNVPARFRGGAFADLSVEAERNADDIERAAARVAAAQLRIADYGETPANLTRRGRAQQDLDRLTNRQTVINASFQRELTSAQIQQVVSPDAERQVDGLRARFETLANDLRQLGGTRFNGLIAGVGSVVEQLNRGTASAKEARQAVDSFAAAASSVNINRNLAQQTESLLYSPTDLQRRQIQSNFDRQVSRLAPDDPARRGPENERDIGLTRLRLNSEIIPRTQGLADSAKGFGDPKLEQQANRLLQYNREISAELRRQDNLNANKNYDAAAASLKTINRLLAEQSQLEAEIAGDISTANAARRQTELFLRASGRSSEKLSQGARDAASDLDVGAQFRGGIKDGGARIRIETEMMRIEESVRNLQKAMAAVAASDLGADEKAAELDRLDNQIRQSTGGLDEFIAAESGGVYGKDQIASAMKRGRNNAGSFGVGGAASAQLAIQQGLFAVDDFISSTGPLEYKLRAIGNNITQLGLLLGQSGLIAGLDATRGLFIALGATIGANVGLALLRFATNTQEAEKEVEVLNKSLERQKSLAESLASAYGALAKSVGEAGMTQNQRTRQSRDEQLSDIAKRRDDLLRERVSGSDRSVIQNRLEIQDLEEKLKAPRGSFESESDYTNRRIGISRRIERLRQEQEAIGNSRLRRPITDAAARDAIAGRESTIPASSFTATGLDSAFSLRRDLREAGGNVAGGDRRSLQSAIQRQIDVLERFRADLQDNAQFNTPQGNEARAALGTVDAEIGRLTDVLNGFTDIAQQNYAAADAVARKLFSLGDELGAGLSIVENVFGELASSSKIAAEIGRLSDVANQLDQMANEAVAKGQDPSAFEADADAAREMARQLTAAATALQTFSDVMRRAGESVSADNATMQNRADDARRADIGNSTPSTRSARARAEADAEASRRRERRFQDDMATAREQAEQDMIDRQDQNARRRAEIDRQLAVPANETSPDGVQGGTVDERGRLRAERRRLEDDARNAVENSPAARAATAERDRATADVERARSADRGRELAQTPAERAGKELAQSLVDVREEFKQRGQDPSAANRRIIDDSMRQTAPAIFGMADQVMNAVVQGPSRASLQAMDISTAQGGSELSRLLRGDDSARNQNLVELQKQSAALAQLVSIAQENGAPPGVFDN
jgi:hypothetical protein